MQQPKNKILSCLSSIIFISTLLNGIQAADIKESKKELLEKLVNINSGTKNVAGLNKTREILIKEFEKIGFQTNVIKLKKERKVLVFEYPNSKPYILFSGHIDTIFKKDNTFSYNEKENIIEGPGIIDMKSGIVLMIDILEDLPSNLKKNIRIVLNDDEEIGSPFSRNELKRLTKDLKYGFILEPGLSNGDVVTSHSGVKWVKLKVKGQSAHAGKNHKKGVNACVELSHKIVNISKLTNYEKGLTVNPGTLEGGTKPNVVCESASSMIDIRYQNTKDLTHLLEKINYIAKTPNVKSFYNTSAKGFIEEIAYLPALPKYASKKLYKIVSNISTNFGSGIKGVHVGYGTDAGHIYKNSIDLIVGIGPYGGGMHTNSEFLEKRSYIKRKILIQETIKELAKESL